MGIFRFDRDGTIVAFEEKPKRSASPDRPQHPAESTFAHAQRRQPFMASMGIYVFTRRVLVEMLHREAGLDFGRELIPNALGKYKVMPYLYRGYWADVGTIESFLRSQRDAGRPMRHSASGIPSGRSTRTCGICRRRGCRLPRERFDRRRRLLAESMPSSEVPSWAFARRDRCRARVERSVCSAPISTSTGSRPAICLGLAWAGMPCWIA
jgi:hypothetical protein